MANYTVEINTDENDREAGLQYVVAQSNEAIAARNAQLPEGAEPEPLLEGKTYLLKSLDTAIDSYAAYTRKVKSADLGEKFERADQASRDQVEIILAQFQPIAAESASLKVA